MSPSKIDVPLNDINFVSYDVQDKKDDEESSLEDALDLIGFGRVQLEVLLVGGVHLMWLINETMGINILTVASQCDFQTDSQEKAIMSAAGFVGILVVAYPCGYLCDSIGRRSVMIPATLSALVFSFAAMFVSNFWLFVMLRFFTGIGISGTIASVYPYIGEFCSMKYRAACINYASLFVGFSALYSSAVAWFILSQTWNVSIFGLLDFRPWRLLILVNLLPGIIGTIWMWRLPESPKLYLSHGKDSEALKVLYWIYEKNTRKPSKEFHVKRLIPESNKEFIQNLAQKKTIWEIALSMWRQTMALFKPPHIRNYSICCFIMFGIYLLSSGMGLWYPEIQNRVGFGTIDSKKTICEVINQEPNKTLAETCNDEIGTNTYIGTIVLGGSYIVAYLLIGVIINPLGRKAILTGALGLSGACGIALLWIDEPTIIVILFCGYLMLSGLCGSVVSGCLVDLIPTHLRGKAVCMCQMFGRLGSVLGTYTIGAILESNCETTFNLFSGFIILCALLALLLPI